MKREENKRKRQLSVESCRFLLAHPRGFEPPTCRLGGGCSIQLSYGCILSDIISAERHSVNESGYIFLPETYTVGNDFWKGERTMDDNEQQQQDVDDLIFEGEEWKPSDR